MTPIASIVASGTPFSNLTPFIVTDENGEETILDRSALKQLFLDLHYPSGFANEFVARIEQVAFEKREVERTRRIYERQVETRVFAEQAVQQIVDAANKAAAILKKAEML